MMSEIEVDDFDKMLVELVDSNELQKEGFALFVFGHGCQTKSFYKELKHNSDIELYWSGWSGPRWLWFLSFILGRAGLLRIKDVTKTKEIYAHVGALSYCELYFIPENRGIELIGHVKKGYWKFGKEGQLDALFANENEYFLLGNDFDYYGGDRDGEVYNWRLRYGNNISDNLKRILKIR
jgi:hypothetical protein